VLDTEASAERHWAVGDQVTSMCLEEFKAFVQGAWLNTSGPITAFVRAPKLMREAETVRQGLISPSVTSAEAEKIRAACDLNDLVKGFRGLGVHRYIPTGRFYRCTAKPLIWQW